MKVTDLSKTWDEGRKSEDRPRNYRLRLPLEDAARLAALAELYPNRSEEEILNDIANGAVEDLAELNGLKDGKNDKKS
ncbi:hypothetical protein [Hydrocarboniclastica marina]|uniref:Arc family DNA-binding protein n=1 Tax=Hydrocarboniclastica marina TaxID=2259620 RepID=A0A4P7XFE4_9ALTE|nr:hypothetical protein [Hydrocarboniclastica marina]MAL99719.1 hypothetical protein [Alteromonadaceae bacterium]QCF25303.1 hypothetical protein soil367_04805 [Hydrocarboniclastica marina]|tara:strand:- start:3860 stop:4093 length:234 start_codon:yes stop_codon:yes gene_type:complete